MAHKTTKLIHEGEYVAEVEIEFIIGDDEWSPHLSLEDAYKLDYASLYAGKGAREHAFLLLPVPLIHLVIRRNTSSCPFPPRRPDISPAGGIGHNLSQFMTDGRQTAVSQHHRWRQPPHHLPESSYK